MTITEVFNDWLPLINKSILFSTLEKIPLDKPICPLIDNVFKAFQLCSLSNCKAVMLGQDPYPQKEVATGVLFGNKAETEEKDISPSLRVIKEASIDFTTPHNEPINFDNSLEYWCSQGVLMLNSALTVEQNKVGSHTMIWRPFIADFLRRLSKYDNNLVFALFGEQAQTFTPYIYSNNILVEKHPSFYARTNSRMSSKIFYDINKAIMYNSQTPIQWYNEYVDISANTFMEDLYE